MTAAALATGVLVGLAYTVSPMTVVFASLLVPLFWWAGRGVPDRERRWLFGVLAVAVVLRVAAVAALLLLTDPMTQHFNAFVPDSQAALARSWWIRNIWTGVPIGPWYLKATYDPYGASPYWYVLAAIQMIVGPAPYGLNFVSTLAFLGGSVALYRLVRRSYGPAIALAGFAAVVCWPSTFVWSVATLKESVQYGLTALLFVCVIQGLRACNWSARAAAVLGAAVALVALDGLRSGALAISGAGVAAGVLGRALTTRRAVLAASVLVLVGASALVLSRPAVQARMLAVARESADRQLGHVASFGYGYKVLDQRFYSQGRSAIESMTPDEAVRYVVRAGAAFFLVPLPWQIASASGLRFLPQQLAWYGLLALGVPGLVVGMRRDPLLTWLLAAYVVAGTVVIAPNSGNIGTLVRHRDVVVFALVWLSAAGAWSIVGRRRDATVRSLPPRAAVNHA